MCYFLLKDDEKECGLKIVLEISLQILSDWVHNLG